MPQDPPTSSASPQKEPLQLLRAHPHAHGCPHLAARKAPPLLEAFRCCVRYSLTFRRRFQMHVNRKGREFRAMVNVDDDEAAATAAGTSGERERPAVSSSSSSSSAIGPSVSHPPPQDTPRESLKDTSIESSEETSIETSKETHIESSKETHIESSKETPSGTLKETPPPRKRRRSLASSSLERIVQAAARLPPPACAVCGDMLSSARLHACLHCVFVGCWANGHIQAHLASEHPNHSATVSNASNSSIKDKDMDMDMDTDKDITSDGDSSLHNFAVDFAHLAVFCAACGDYVYDHDLERILYAEQARIAAVVARVREPNLRRPTARPWTPSAADAAAIAAHSRPLKCAGVRGLRNMGSTCFMNCILQTFVHNPLLRAHFLSDRHHRDICTFAPIANPAADPAADTPCLACELDDLFRNFYGGRTSPYGPTAFLYAIWKSQRHLAVYQQQDAHEFFISALNQIHICCSASLATSHADLQRHCKCIIHQVFGGVLQSDVTCLKCGNVTTTIDPILDISLDIKPGAKTTPKKPVKRTSEAVSAAAAATAALAFAGKGLPSSSIPSGSGSAAASAAGHGTTGSLSTSGSAPPLSSLGSPTTTNTSSTDDRQAKTNSQHPHSLVDCLDGFTHPERLGANQYTCSTCDNTFQEATKQLSMKRLPPVLAIQLKRFEHSPTGWTKIDTFVRVPADLDMTPHTTRSVKLRARLRAARKDPSRKIPLRGIAGFDTITDGIPTYKYTLFAIVNHEGKMDTGHYKAYVKSRHQWFLFDDHSVTLTTQKAALECNGYICLYIRDNAEYASSSVSEIMSDSGTSVGGSGVASSIPASFTS